MSQLQYLHQSEITMVAVADKGFPMGGGADLWQVCFLAKTHAKQKNWILLGGAHRRRPWIRQWVGLKGLKGAAKQS